MDSVLLLIVLLFIVLLFIGLTKNIENFSKKDTGLVNGHRSVVKNAYDRQSQLSLLTKEQEFKRPDHSVNSFMRRNVFGSFNGNQYRSYNEIPSRNALDRYGYNCNKSIYEHPFDESEHFTKEEMNDDLSTFTKTYHGFINRHIPNRDLWERKFEKNIHSLKDMQNIHDPNFIYYAIKGWTGLNH